MKKIILFLSVITMMLLITACGGEDSSGESDSTGEDSTINIGVQTYTDPKLMAQMVQELIEQETDHDVEVIQNIQASSQVIASMENGDVDIATMFTDELHNNHFDSDEVNDTTNPEETVEQTQNLFDEHYDFRWFDPIGFTNQHSITVPEEWAEENGVSQISELEEYADEMTLGSDNDWLNREESGYNDFQEHYGFGFQDTKGLSIALMYNGMEDGQFDAITAYTVAPQIKDLNLVTLEDDQEFFPPTLGSLVARNEVIENNPELEEILASFSDTISTEKMTDLIYQVEIEGNDVGDVARNFLEEEGLIKGE